MSDQKIIFLDFDVPATNRLTALATGSPFELNPLVIRILNNICKASGAQIVCSSNRAGLDARDDVMGLLSRAGLDVAHVHPDWSCSYENTYKPEGRTSAQVRTDNIRRWLAEHPKVTTYAAIDDLALDMPNLVLVKDQNNGLLFEDVQKLCHFLTVDLNDVVLAANPGGHARIKFPTYKPQ